MQHINKLFILGNGFDLAHGLETKYEDFKEWICNEYLSEDESNRVNIYLPMAGIDQYGGEDFSESEKAEFILCCMDDLSEGDWCDFEEKLGRIDWYTYLDQAEDIFDDERDLHRGNTLDNKQEYAKNLFIGAEKFTELFTLWIQSIDIAGVEQKAFLDESRLSNSTFLTFNFTKVLEKIYQVNEEYIFHVHGKYDETIIIGHGGEEKEVLYDDDYDWLQGFNYITSNDICNKLKKPTETIIKDSSFFRELKNSNIQKIYSWGFSFSEVDRCYIVEVCKALDTTNIEWFIYKHGETDIIRWILRECGFKGRVKEFCSEDI